MNDYRLTVIKNKTVSKKYHLLTLGAQKSIPQPFPGQFIMLAVNEYYVPLLRRPFSIFKYYSPATIEILYNIRGIGTHILQKKSPGENMNAILPLGKGFSVPKDAKSVILVAGGIGIAPLVSLANTLSDIECEVRLLWGIDSDEFYFEPFVQDRYKKYSISSVDGSIGFKGTVLELLENELKNFECDYIAACGPFGMLKGLSDIVKEKDMPVQISWEEKMACGYGACRGCVVECKCGDNVMQYKLTCKDGPVFNLKDVAVLN